MIAYTVREKEITQEDIKIFLKQHPHINHKIQAKMNASKFEYKRSLFEKYNNE
jgi:hypothetical protein